MQIFCKYFSVALSVKGKGYIPHPDEPRDEALVMGE